MEIKLDSDNNLPLNKTIEVHIMTVVVRAGDFLKITNIIHKFF